MKKIIHIDMDCFYAAIEMKDNPSLKNKPIAVGASPQERGVLCTSNYIARQYGVKSAMPTATAYRLCPELILLPVNMAKYKEVAKRIHRIFHEVTPLVEPLSLDEAYLDVTNSPYCRGSATLIAQMIRERILEREELTASAGVAPNKFLAKIASGWRKPNGLFVIRPDEVREFVRRLPVERLFGVGKVTAKKLHQMNIITCEDLLPLSRSTLMDHFGKMGQMLYEQCRGIDDRSVCPNRERKSLSVERTFNQDIHHASHCLELMTHLHTDLQRRLKLYANDRAIKNQYIKVKFHDFKSMTAETQSNEPDLQQYQTLFRQLYEKNPRPIRLLGLGVHFDKKHEPDRQLSFDVS